jgi:hypothetical protein
MGWAAFGRVLLRCDVGSVGRGESAGVDIAKTVVVEE